MLCKKFVKKILTNNHIEAMRNLWLICPYLDRAALKLVSNLLPNPKRFHL